MATIKKISGLSPSSTLTGDDFVLVEDATSGALNRATINELGSTHTYSEAMLAWGGGNKVASYSPIDASMIPELGANRLAFGAASAITVTYYVGIHSDTYGFRMGFEEGKAKLDVAVSGFVLAYVDKDYLVGTPLTCTKDGYLTEISKEDKRDNPEMIIAKYWKSEPAEEWGTDTKKVKVNGRRWVKIK